MSPRPATSRWWTPTSLRSHHVPHHPGHRHDVLVVGAGPAGLTAAITLARHGVDVLVIEKHRGTSPFPKATGVSTRTMELLRAWGIDQRVRAGAMPVQPRAVGLRDACGRRSQADRPVRLPDRHRGARRQPGHARLSCPRTTWSRCCVDHLIERGGTVRFGTELTALHVVPFGMHGRAARPRHRPARAGSAHAT